MAPLKHLSNFWRTLDMPLINCEINFILTWYDRCVLPNDTKATVATTGTKRYFSVVTLSAQDNAKLLEEWKSSFNSRINSNRYEPKVSEHAPNPYLEFLIKPSFVLSFEFKDYRTVHTKYYLPNCRNKGL